MSTSALAPGVDPRVRVVPAGSDEHERLERTVLDGGGVLPLDHRAVWHRAFGGRGAVFLGVPGSSGAPGAGLVVEAAFSRSLPGHRLLRVKRYLPPASAEVERTLLHALREQGRQGGPVLRIAVELFCREDERRKVSEQTLSELGFEPVEAPRRYEHTLALALGREEGELLRSFHGSARKRLKEVAKLPVRVESIVDTAWASRLGTLVGEALRRTAGDGISVDWARLIEFGRRHPEHVRVVGLFLDHATGPESLVAFATGINHGDHVVYDAAGSTRLPDQRIPMGYPLLSDLICWANRTDARWFDFGGVTFGRAGDGADALGGISDFKRSFCREVAHVGGEWVFEPSPLRSRVARAVSDTMAWAKRLRSGSTRR